MLGVLIARTVLYCLTFKSLAQLSCYCKETLLKTVEFLKFNQT